MIEFMPWIWLAVIVTLLIIEACTTQMVSIWFAAGAIAALIYSIFYNSIFAQIFVFIAVTSFMLVLTRPFVKKVLNFAKEDFNCGRYIGKTGVVIHEINNTLGEGQVKISGNVWSAKSNDDSIIKNGEIITVNSIKGVKLIVKRM